MMISNKQVLCSNETMLFEVNLRNIGFYIFNAQRKSAAVQQTMGRSQQHTCLPLYLVIASRKRNK